MNIIKMNKYGRLLTGREFGKNTAQSILNQRRFPLILDFSEVLSMGSSFAEEVVPVVASQQGNVVNVTQINAPIRSVLRDVSSNTGVVVHEV